MSDILKVHTKFEVNRLNRARDFMLATLKKSSFENNAFEVLSIISDNRNCINGIMAC